MARFTLLPTILSLAPALLGGQTPPGWRVHEMTRPRPAVVPAGESQLGAPPPPGAIVLFDGTTLAHWVGADGKPARWTVRRGYFQVRPGTGAIATTDSFGDMQLHLEWAAPVPARGAGQDRGNSGVFLMGRYELQILDSYHSDTYTDGQAGAMYGQHPPLFNASRPPGQWQTYDVFFRRPRFDASGALLAAARVTVLHNGVPVQNNVELYGPTSWLSRLPYQAHPDRLPLALQDHSFPVRFRNIWVRPLPEGDAPPPPRPVRLVPDSELERFVGSYTGSGGKAIVAARDRRLWLDLGDGPMPLNGETESGFTIEGVDATVSFAQDSGGAVSGFGFEIGGETRRYTREQ